MRREQFIQYLENPFLLGDESITGLKELVETYPFFQTAHLLYAKALSNVNHADYYTGLKRTSILAGDRKVLYELITGKPKTPSTVLPLTEEKKEKAEVVANTKIEALEQAEELQLPEIKLVSNTISPTRNQEIKVDFEAKNERNELPVSTTETEKKTETEKTEPVTEKVTRVELVVSTREKENQETEKKEEQKPVEVEKHKQEIFVPKEKNVDDVVLDRVVNAYIEKEILGVDEIDKPVVSVKAETIDPEEGKQILTQTLNEPHSFSEWLKLLNQGVKPSHTKTETVQLKDEKGVEELKSDLSLQEDITGTSVKNPLDEKEKIIEKIISSEPKISRPVRENKEFFKPQEKSKESIIKDETLVTETLAWILEKQGKYPEAIKAYHFLSLKYPEKSIKFASLISEIRKKQKQK